MKIVLKRDKNTGNYYWGKFEISKGVIGWNVYRWSNRYHCFLDYEFSVATLEEARKTLANYE